MEVEYLRLLFHKDVFMPSGVQEIVHKLQKCEDYYYSWHFKSHLSDQLVEDKSHTYLKDVVDKCIANIKNQCQDAFEVELSKATNINDETWYVTKFCIRMRYDDNTDLAVVLRPQIDISCFRYTDSNLVVTAWINHRKDNHKTLNTLGYCDEEKWNRFKGNNCIIK